ncbi:MAG TPA: hypothetical protein VJ717_13960 [Gemmatimonadaceae bacterium]|nr:hypothetical protein [Gemmatimonadaceae bacterium]
MRKRRGWILIVTMAASFLVMRGSMALRPDADFNVAGYNIHHLFTGLLILTICGIPLIIGNVQGRMGDWLTAGFGIGLALALDEWVYLIATDGSNASYLLPVSFWGGVIIVGAAIGYAALLLRRKDR